MAEYKEVEWHIDSALVIFLTVRDVDLEPANLTGLTGEDIRCAFFTKPGRLADDEEPTKILDLDDGITIVTAATGAIKITLAEGNQDDFVAETQYYYEVKTVLASGTHTQLYGPALCKESIFENIPAT
jgi:hypothetical protein